MEKKFEVGAKFVSIGGINEDRIGGNAYLIEHTDSKGNTVRIINDLGSMFTPYESDFHVAIPNIDKYFDLADLKSDQVHKASDPVSAIFLTHVHEDHVGALIHAVRMGYNLPPIYASRFTRNLLRLSFYESGIEPPMIYNFKSGDVLKISDNMEVESFNVSHSAVDSIGFCVSTFKNGEPDVTIVNNGDFLIDEDMPLGQPFSMKDYIAMIERRKAPTMVSFMDSTSVNSENDTAKRIGFDQAVENVLDVIYDNMDRDIIISPVISRSVQNIAIDLEAARQMNTKIKCDGKWLNMVIKAMKLSDYKDYDDVIYNGNLSQYLSDPHVSRKYIPCTGAFAQGLEDFEKNQGEPNRINMSSSVKIALGLHQDIQADNNMLVLGRQRIIDEINGKTGPKMYQLLATQGAKVVLSGSKVANLEQVQMQDSGHINKEKLKELLVEVKKVAPDMIYIPYHGNIGQCAMVAKVIEESGLACQQVCNLEEVKIADGKVIEANKEEYRPPFTWIAGRLKFPNPLDKDLTIPFQGRWEYHLVDQYYQSIEKVAEADNNMNRRPQKKEEYKKSQYEDDAALARREKMLRQNKKNYQEKAFKNKQKKTAKDRHGRY